MSSYFPRMVLMKTSHADRIMRMNRCIFSIFPFFPAIFSDILSKRKSLLFTQISVKIQIGIPEITWWKLKSRTKPKKKLNAKHTSKKSFIIYSFSMFRCWFRFCACVFFSACMMNRLHCVNRTEPAENIVLWTIPSLLIWFALSVRNFPQ